MDDIFSPDIGITYNTRPVGDTFLEKIDDQTKREQLDHTVYSIRRRENRDAFHNRLNSCQLIRLN